MFNVGDRVRGVRCAKWGDTYVGIEGTMVKDYGDTITIDIESSTKSNFSIFARGNKGVGVFRIGFVLIEDKPEPYESFFL